MNTKNTQELYSELLSNKDNFLATANQILESNYWAIELDTPLVPLPSFCKAMLPHNVNSPIMKYVDGMLKFKDALNYIVDYIRIGKIKSYGEKPNMKSINSAYTALTEYWQNELEKDFEELELTTKKEILNLKDKKLNLLIDAFLNSFKSLESTKINLKATVNFLLTTTQGKAMLSPYLVKYLEEHKPAHEAELSNEVELSNETEFSKEVELSNEFIFALYETSLKCYERDIMKRANDSLPKRIRILLWHIDKKICTLLNIDCPNSANKSEDITKAKERDIPKLLENYPNLPELKF